jgi:hypothetical protein
MARRRGDVNQFWNNAAVGIGGVSAIVSIGNEVNQVAIFTTVSAATTVKVQVAHSGDMTAEGILPDGTPVTFFDLFYLNTAVTQVFSAGGSAAMIIPDFAPQWIRLVSSAAATITAGWVTGSN